MQLSDIVLQKFLANNLVGNDEEIQLKPCHQIVIERKIYSHYVIFCPSSQKKFFLKFLKPGEGQLHCDKYFDSFKNSSIWNEYPRIIIPPFEFNGSKYFVTSYFDAENLDTLLENLSPQQYQDIGEKIFDRLLELEQLHATKYSDRGNFVDQPFEVLFIEKLHRRFRHQSMASFPPNIIERLCSRCETILKASSFSPPTMIHMDIKPENILYSPSDKKIYLIDFEFARFGDIDYGWAQVLLSGFNAFHPVYRRFIYPNIIKQRKDLFASLQIPKMKCYFLYQTLCNKIYYHDRKLNCPSAFEKIFYSLIKEFV